MDNLRKWGETYVPVREIFLLMWLATIQLVVQEAFCEGACQQLAPPEAVACHDLLK